MSLLLDLILWLFVAVAHPFVDVAEPVPTPAVLAEVRELDQTAPGPVVTPGARPTTPHYAPPAPPAPVEVPAPPAPEVLAGPVECAGEYLPGGQWCAGRDPVDVAEQLPDETIGRATE